MPVEDASSTFEPDAEAKSGDRTRLAFWLVALAFGLFVTLSQRSYMNPDGISYLDLGDAFWRRDWQSAINGYWSPLYGWLLGLVLNLFRIGPLWEFLAVHLVNFGIYTLALLSFDFFVRTLISHHRASAHRYGNTFTTLPNWVWYGLGFSLFIWSSISRITVSVVTPDMLNSAVVHLASGLLVRIRTKFLGARPFGLLGVVLGLGYLTRASMFPLAFVFLGAALASPGGFRRSLPGALLGAAAFLLVSAPFIAGLSLKEGRLTVGSTGKLNYASEVNGVSKVHWQGGPPGCGSPRHPARKIFEAPAVYEFGTPIVATDPLWFDPSYWNDGIIPCFDWHKQLRVLKASTLEILKNGFGRASALAVAVIAILYWEYSAGHGDMLVKGFVDNAHLFIIACAGFATYAWVLVVPRYIVVFVTLAWMGTLSAVRLPRAPEPKQIVRAVTIAAIAVMLSLIAGQTLSEPPWLGDRNWEVAEALGRMGIRPGDKVAVFGTLQREYYWARLARARIVAEIPNESLEAFWAAAPRIKAKAIDALLSTGAKGIIAVDIPGTSDLGGWKEIGTTGFFVYLSRGETNDRR